MTVFEIVFTTIICMFALYFAIKILYSCFMVKTLVWGLNNYDEAYEKTVEKFKTLNTVYKQEVNIPDKEEIRRQLRRELDMYRHDWLIGVIELFLCPLLLLIVYSI